MDPDAGDGHMIPQRRLPAGRHAPRHAPRHAFAPHLTATPRATTSRIGHPTAGERFQISNLERAAAARPTRTPPKHPRCATLMLHRHQANSRFLTDCYLFPAALWSGPCPKLGPAKPTPSMQAGAASRTRRRRRVQGKTTGKNKWLGRESVGGARWPHGHCQRGAALSSVRLPAEKGWNVELIRFRRVMHSAGPAVVIESLRRGAFGVFGDRLGTRLSRARHGPARQAVSPWHRGHSGRARRRRRRFCSFLAAAEADRSQAL